MVDTHWPAFITSIFLPFFVVLLPCCNLRKRWQLGLNIPSSLCFLMSATFYKVNRTKSPSPKDSSLMTSVMYLSILLFYDVEIYNAHRICVEFVRTNLKEIVDSKIWKKKIHEEFHSGGLRVLVQKLTFVNDFGPPASKTHVVSHIYSKGCINEGSSRFAEIFIFFGFETWSSETRQLSVFMNFHALQ